MNFVYNCASVSAYAIVLVTVSLAADGYSESPKPSSYLLFIAHSDVNQTWATYSKICTQLHIRYCYKCLLEFNLYKKEHTSPISTILKCVVMLLYSRYSQKNVNYIKFSLPLNLACIWPHFYMEQSKLKSMILFIFNVIIRKQTNSWVFGWVIFISCLCEMACNTRIAIINCYFMRFYQYILNSIISIYYCSHLRNIL